MGFLNNFMSELEKEKDKEIEQKDKNRESKIQDIMTKNGLNHDEAVLIYEGINDVSDFNKDSTVAENTTQDDEEPFFKDE